jgi:hypothetical protein
MMIPYKKELDDDVLKPNRVSLQEIAPSPQHQARQSMSGTVSIRTFIWLSSAACVMLRNTAGNTARSTTTNWSCQV